MLVFQGHAHILPNLVVKHPFCAQFSPTEQYFFLSTPAVCLHLLRKIRMPPPKSSWETTQYCQQHNPVSLNIS